MRLFLKYLKAKTVDRFYNWFSKLHWFYKLLFLELLPPLFAIFWFYSVAAFLPRNSFTFYIGIAAVFFFILILLEIGVFYLWDNYETWKKEVI